MATIEIDGKSLEVKDGSMIIEAADAAGITIPRFCYHEKLSIAANCRMCLVEVEKAPKPLPACATPVADGMKISTNSELAIEAQNGTMEFLLINHPLDCPVCDQGGECPLQDQALGYGKGQSRYQETKRVVENKNIGPLVSTEMTRCIHCTRCVRFGQEVAGVMELGTVGRGENMEIDVVLGDSVDTELSGNLIDLCPVGALTSRPYRFSARVWELEGRRSISPHDSLGSNIEVQSIRNEVKRVLPRDNEAVNECWISDRDRFSYEGINSTDRLLQPQINTGKNPQAADWQSALQAAADGIRKAISEHGAESLAVLISPSATTEEHYLLQRLVRTLGSGNVDHRLRQSDFRGSESHRDEYQRVPDLGRSVASLSTLDACVLIGCNVRKEQPLMSARLRQAVKAGARVSDVNPVAFDFNFKSASRIICSPSAMVADLALIAECVAKATNTALPASIEALVDVAQSDQRDAAKAIADSLLDAQGDETAGERAVLLGALAQQSPFWSELRQLGLWIADASGASFGEIPEANSAGASVAGAVYYRDVVADETTAYGRPLPQLLGDTDASTQQKPRCWILFGIEPELDCVNAVRLRKALDDADFVVHFSSFAADPSADVALPIAAFAENEGSYVNCEGLSQTFDAAVTCPGETRPGWKIVRVLGNLLAIPGFDYVTVADVRREINFDVENQAAPGKPGINLDSVENSRALQVLRDGTNKNNFERIFDVPMYRIDATVRRGDALQQTLDNPAPAAHLNPVDISALALADADTAVVRGESGDAVELALVADGRIPQGCAYIPMGWSVTAALDSSSNVTFGK